MKLSNRLGYFSIGLIIGVFVLFFFLSGKKTTCDYGPNARTLKNIRLKSRVFSEESLQALKSNELDTTAISNLLKNGNVLFSESQTNLDSCKIYVIEGEVSKKLLKIKVENCSEEVKIMKTEILKNT